MASGRPSSARQICATVRVTPASISSLRLAASADCTNSCTAGLSSASKSLSLAGSGSGSTSNTCSPRIRSAVRLETSTRILGATASSSAINMAAAGRCSKLSIARSNSRSRR